MAALVRIITPQFYIVGDGVATSIQLSLSEAPFPANLPGKPVAVAFRYTDANLSSISLDTPPKTCTITFASAFSGAGAGPVDVFADYDPS